MPQVCILTDNTAQFTRASFSSRERVFQIPFRLAPLPQPERNRPPGSTPTQQLIPPDKHTFLRYFMELSQTYDGVLTITLASSLSPIAHTAQKAASQYTNHATISVVDSQTTAVGLGLIVQEAAEVAASGVTLVEVERYVRARIPHVYTLFCIPELSYLTQTGHLSYAQALVGEMMGLLPIFTLEEGRLMPLEKVRTQRHMFESLQEFIDEFEKPDCVALLRGLNQNTIRTRPLRQYVHENFPGTVYSEHAISPYAAALFGSQCVGLVVTEKTRGT